MKYCGWSGGAVGCEMVVSRRSPQSQVGLNTDCGVVVRGQQDHLALEIGSWCRE